MLTVKDPEMREIFRLRAEVARLEGKLKNETQRRRNAERDLKFVAKFFCKTQGFFAWLLEQDLSSMKTYRPLVERHVPVEGRDDVEMAIEYSKWLDRRSQNPTS